jgi:hypothetical protein
MTPTGPAPCATVGLRALLLVPPVPPRMLHLAIRYAAAVCGVGSGKRPPWGAVVVLIAARRRLDLLRWTLIARGLDMTVGASQRPFAPPMAPRAPARLAALTQGLTSLRLRARLLPLLGALPGNSTGLAGPSLVVTVLFPR